MAWTRSVALVTVPLTPVRSKRRYVWTIGEPSNRSVVSVPVFRLGLDESTYASATGESVTEVEDPVVAVVADAGPTTLDLFPAASRDWIV